MTLVSERYTISDRELGRGSFSTVYLGTRLYDGLSVAVKMVPCTSLTSGRIRQEIQILERVHHRHLIQLYEWQVVRDPEGDRETYYLFLRLCQGTLRDLPPLVCPAAREARARELLTGIVEALVYLHEQGYLHRDLKPDNILLAVEGSQTIPQLADLGLAGTIDPGPGTRTVCGSRLYMAPEVMDSLPYTGQADVWSLGVLLYGLLVDTLPHQTTTVAGLRAALSRLTASSLPEGYTPELRDLLDRMLQPDPQTRLTLHQVQEHRWWTGSRSTTEAVDIPGSRSEPSPYYGSQRSLRIGRISDSPLGWSGLSRMRGQSCPEPAYLGFHHVL